MTLNLNLLTCQPILGICFVVLHPSKQNFSPRYSLADPIRTFAVPSFGVSLATSISTMSRPSEAAPIPEIILRAGATETITFDFELSLSLFPHWRAGYTIGFDFKNVPFGGSSGTNPNGFLNKSQQERFQFDFTILTNHSCRVLLAIINVHYEDEGAFESILYVFSETDIQTMSLVKIATVLPPPLTARCFIISKNFQDTCLYEVHCHTSIDASPSCFQNGVNIPHVGNTFSNETHTRAVFLIKPNASVHCCSHIINWKVTQEMCNDFEIHVSQPSDIHTPSPNAGSEDSSESKDGSTTETISTVGKSGCNGQFHLSSYNFIVTSYFISKFSLRFFF